MLYYYTNNAQLQVNAAKKLHIGDYLGLKNVKKKITNIYKSSIDSVYKH